MSGKAKWEYGFYDSETGGPNIWFGFGLPFVDAERAKHTGEKNCWGHPVIVRRRPGSPDWEHVTQPTERATPDLPTTERQS